MKKFLLLMSMVLLSSIIFWSCAQKDPIGIEQYKLDVPTTSNFSVDTNLLMEGDDYSIGYYNGSIQSDQINLSWTQSTDEDFLCYKVMRVLGEPQDRSLEGFENGYIPVGWTTSGYLGGWFVTNENAFNGNYCARTHQGYDEYEVLEVTLSVSQYADIYISFWAAAVNSGSGSFYVNDYEYDYWSNNQWGLEQSSFNTYNNTSINLKWIYYTNNGGYGLLDDIQILGANDNEMVSTITDISATSFIDTALVQNSFYTYNVVSINNTGIYSQDEVTIKTPQWSAPDSVLVNGLSTDVIEITWNDNTESEDNFLVYTYYDNATTWTLIDSALINKNVTSLVIDDLDTNEVYKFGVKAVGSFEDDTMEGLSSTFYFNSLTLLPPSTLTGYQNFGFLSISLNWIDNSTLETGFSIERKIENGFFEEIATIGHNITEFTDNDTLNFELGLNITYRVRAFNDYEELIYSAYSNEVTISLTDLEPVRTLSYWAQAGPEGVDEDENLDVSYYASDGSWVLIRSINYYEANGWTYFEDEIDDVNAMHPGFKIRFQQSDHSGDECDNWHIDDVSILAGQYVIFEDDFSTDTISSVNWQVQDYSYITSSQVHSSPYALYFNSYDYEIRQIITTNIPW
jgi:hypothetical protein